MQAVEQWDRLEITLQGTAIDGGDYSVSYYLEVESQLDEPGISDDPVLRWPFNANSIVNKR
jgi:hypothetical protein